MIHYKGNNLEGKVPKLKDFFLKKKKSTQDFLILFTSKHFKKRISYSDL